MTPHRGGVLREGYDYDFSRADPDGRARRPGVVRDLRDRGRRRSRGPARPDARRVVAAGSGRTTASGGSGSGRRCASSRGRRATPKRSPTRFACTATGRGADQRVLLEEVAGVRAEGDEVLVELHQPSAGMPRLLRSWHSAIHNQAPRRAPATSSGVRAATGPGRSRSSSRCRARTWTCARWDGYRARARPGSENRGAAVPRRRPLGPDPRRPRARRGARARARSTASRTPSLLDVERLAANPDIE